MKNRKTFTERQKRQIVLEVLSGELTKEQARRIYKIKAKSSILEWMRIFAHINPKLHGIDPRPYLLNMKEQPEDIRKLKARIEYLEEELKLSQLKSSAYQKIVKNAERTYKIEILKKGGAKQFTKSKKKERK